MDYEALTEWILTLDDATCADLFRQARYGPSMVPSACPTCDTTRFGRIAARVRVDACKGCSAQISVTANTALHGVKHPLCYVLVAAVLITREGSISTRQLAKVLDLKWKSARTLGHRVRRALAEDKPALTPGQVRIEILNAVVRRDQGEYPKTRWLGRVMPPTVRAIALVDQDTGSLVVTFGERTRAMALKRLVETHLPGVEDVPWPQCTGARTTRDIDRVLARAHQRVSRRWIPLYIDALAWCVGVQLEARSWRALEVVLAAPRCTWAQLRPARVQEPEKDPLSRFRFPKPPRYGREPTIEVST